MILLTLSFICKSTEKIKGFYRITLDILKAKMINILWFYYMEEIKAVTIDGEQFFVKAKESLK